MLEDALGDRLLAPRIRIETLDDVGRGKPGPDNRDT